MEKLNSFSKSKNRPAYGIDLGTTNSCISVVGNSDVPEIIKLDDGDVLLPSCVLWDGETGEFTVGKIAYKNRAKSNACYSVKRLMGTDEIVKFIDGKRSITKTPAEVSSIILRALVDKASTIYKDIKDVVITVPAGFNNRQIADTKLAGEMAGLNVINIMKEPTAASLVYRLDSTSGNALVYDLGGGTFDVSVVSIQKGSKDSESDLFNILGIDTDKTTKDSLTVRATRGNTHLGGDDLDLMLYKIIEGRLKEQGCPVKDMSKFDKENIILRLEDYKKYKSFASVNINVDFNKKTGESVHYEVPFTPSDLMECTVRIFNKTKKYIDDVITSSKINIDSIVLVGGSTKNEYLRSIIKETYPGVPVHHYINPDESVSKGAAINAKREKFGSTTLDVFDVTSEGIGILADGRITTLISKNQSIPFSVNKLFSTVIDNQELINIEVFEGSGIYKEDNVYLGNLIIDDVPKGKAGTVGVSITLSIDNDGLLSCKSKTSKGLKDVKLVNILGKKVEVQKSGTSVMFDRWYKFANSLNDEDRDYLIELIDNSRIHPSKQTLVIDYIRSHKERKISNE